MEQPRKTQSGIEPFWAPEVEEPNLPEVSGTSFPLLATVLAGFAITIAVQLIIRTDAADDLAVRLVSAIAVFLISTLLFITSIVFAVNAQAHNYLPFIDLGASAHRLLNVRADDTAGWIRVIHRRWEIFHVAALISFYGGILLLLAGVNLIVWEFVGSGIAVVFLLSVLLNIAVVAIVGSRVYRIRAPAIHASDAVPGHLAPGSNEKLPEA
jgi:hypothetical protein